MNRFGSRSGDNSRPSRGRDLSSSNSAQTRENDPCLGCNSTDHVLADRKCKPEYSKIRANLLRKGLDVPSAAAFAASIMKTHYIQLDMELGDGDNVLDTGFVSYAQDAIEENERNVLTAHISSRL